ncbi:MAG: pseudouridine synthase, partial [Clostridia bacterium]
MPEIVYEDNHLLIAIKPPNVLTQGDETGDDCLHEQLKRYIKEKYQKPGEVYLGLVHRLDRPVGGLVAFARTSKAASRLSEQLRSRQMEREYLAVVEGAELADN